MIIISHPHETTRDRILKAAILRFSIQSYEGTSLKDVASDVRVDAAYVHRCFGSKEKLFREVLRVVLQSARLSDDVDDIAAALAEDLLAPVSVHEVRPLDVVVRSFSSPEASNALRDAVGEHCLTPLASRGVKISDRKAALIIGAIGGIGIMRYVLASEPLLDGDDSALRDMIAHMVDAILDADEEEAPAALAFLEKNTFR